MENKKFIKLILNDEYINWINIFIEQYGEFDDCYFLHNGREFLSEKDLIFIGHISTLFDQINKYALMSNMYIVGSSYWNQIHGTNKEIL